MPLRVSAKASNMSPANSGIVSAPCGAIQAKTTPNVSPFGFIRSLWPIKFAMNNDDFSLKRF
jgi:hypothetical protein